MVKGLYKDLIVSEGDFIGIVKALKEEGLSVSAHEYGKALAPLCNSLKVPLTRSKEYPKACNYLIVYGINLDLLRLVTLVNVDYIIVIRRHNKTRVFKDMLRTAFNNIFNNSNHLHHLLKIPIYESGDTRSVSICSRYTDKNIKYRRNWSRFSNLKIYKGKIHHIKYYLRIPTMEEWRREEVKNIFLEELPRALKREVDEKIKFINSIKYPLPKIDPNFVKKECNDIHSTVLLYLAFGLYDKNYHYMMLRNYYHFEDLRGNDLLWNYFSSSGISLIILSNKNIDNKWVAYLEYGNPYTYINREGLTNKQFFNGELLEDIKWREKLLRK